MEQQTLICHPGSPGYVEPGSKEHGQVIGCSSVASVIGRGYQTPLDVWKKIKHMAPDQEHKSIYDRGHAMEPFMADRLREWGRTVKGEQVQYRDPTRPWLIYHADAMMPKWSPLPGGGMDHEGPGVWEAKAPGSHVASQMRENGMTGPYICQGQAGMHVAGAALGAPIEWGTFGYWDYDEWDLVAFDVGRNQRFIDDMLERLDYFWAEYVIKDVPPPDGLPADRPDVPEVGGDLVTLDDDEITEMADQLARLMLDLAPMKVREKGLRDALKDRLTPYSKAIVPGVMRFSYTVGKGKTVYDGPAMFAYLKHLRDTEGISFDPDLFRAVKPGARSFRPTPILD